MSPESAPTFAPAPTVAHSAPPPGAPLRVAMLLYPGLTLLDLVGPQTALGMHGRTHLVWKTRDPVLSDTGVPVVPTATFAECPADLDVLFVPGGAGTAAMMDDREVLDFLAASAPRAAYVTSVCTGSLILAAAGLLDGYRAATHWATRDVLAGFGVAVGIERVVVDRNRVTGGGVTAGIDFGLTLLARLRGDRIARMTQLMMEYEPEPPFDAGSPESAGPELTAIVRSQFAPDEVERMHRVAATHRAAPATPAGVAT